MPFKRNRRAEEFQVFDAEADEVGIGEAHVIGFGEGEEFLFGILSGVGLSR